MLMLPGAINRNYSIVVWWGQSSLEKGQKEDFMGEQNKGSIVKAVSERSK